MPSKSVMLKKIYATITPSNLQVVKGIPVIMLGDIFHYLEKVVPEKVGKKGLSENFVMLLVVGYELKQEPIDNQHHQYIEWMYKIINKVEKDEQKRKQGELLSAVEVEGN